VVIRWLVVHGAGVRGAGCGVLGFLCVPLCDLCATLCNILIFLLCDLCAFFVFFVVNGFHFSHASVGITDFSTGIALASSSAFDFFTTYLLIDLIMKIVTIIVPVTIYPRVL